MSSPWNTTRLYTAVFVVVATIVVYGCDVPVSMLSSPFGTNNTMLPGDSGPGSASLDDEDSKENPPLPPAEELVKDWDKPDVTLFITGRQHGYIEPCGCTGLENQKGGLMRRHSVQKLLRDRGWDLVSIDAGNQIRRFGQQPVIKIRKTYEALCEMEYDVAGFGPDDLKIPTIELLQSMINAPSNGQNPFTCANLYLFGDPSQTNQFRVIQKNDRRIGVTSVLGNEHFEDLKNQDDLTLVDAKQALEKVVPQMRTQQCDLMVLVAQTSEEDGIELAKQFPVFDLLVTTSGAGDPWLLPQQIKTGDHTTQMIQVGVKGMYVGLVGLYVGAGGKRIKYERVALDHRFKDSPEMMDMFAQYQKELEALYSAGDNQDIRPRPHPSGFKFVGSESCNECHDEEYEIWADGVELDGNAPHFKATADIVKPPNDRGAIARHFDPECISCHVTGWNPQNFYPYQTGFINEKKDVLLHGNGCENCHGPGSGHIEAEQENEDQKRIEEMRVAMRLTLAQAKAEACMECHDVDNSPDFSADGAFEEYWEQIKHGEDQ